MGSLDYSSSGVDVDLEREASKILYEAAKKTWKNRKGTLGEIVELFPDFSGVRAINVGNLADDAYMNLGFDGVGTKVEIAERLSKHYSVAFDLFAMVCDDAVIRGAEPVLIGSILDVKTLGKKDQDYLGFIRQLASGYIPAAKAANVAVINGELAELGARINGYGSFNYNWGASVVWFARKSRMITGKDIKPGDYIVALREEGFRSNGLSLVRKILEKEYGNNWHEKDKLADKVLRPSIIYTKILTSMFGGFDKQPQLKINGAAHITGGGIPEKLGRALEPSGYGAIISEPFEPPGIMTYLQDLGKVSNQEAYRTWNMGHGMLIITEDYQKAIDISSSFGIEAKVVGEIKKEKGIKINF